MKLDDFIFYSYCSFMLPILVAMLVGLIILGISNHRNFKEDDQNELEDFIYRLPCRTDSELVALKIRYTNYLTNDYMKSSYKKWNKYIEAIDKQLELNDGKREQHSR